MQILKKFEINRNRSSKNQSATTSGCNNIEIEKLELDPRWFFRSKLKVVHFYLKKIYFPF